MLCVNVVNVEIKVENELKIKVVLKVYTGNKSYEELVSETRRKLRNQPASQATWEAYRRQIHHHLQPGESWRQAARMIDRPHKIPPASVYFGHLAHHAGC